MDLNIHEDFFQISEKSQIQTQFEGNSDANLLVILPTAKDHIDLVEKILKAINIQDLNEVFQLHLNPEDGISLLDHIDETKVKKVISFGFSSGQIGIHTDHRLYQLAKYMDIQFIFTAPLDIVSNHADHKKALWGTLKQWA